MGLRLDFCSDETAYLIPAREVRFAEKRVDDMPTIDFPWLAEPVLGILQALMREVFAHPEKAQAKGAAAHRHIHAHFTWSHAAAEIEQRLQALRQQPIRRLNTKGKQSNHIVPTIHDSRPTTHDNLLSACLIVKNEEDNLAACLESIHGIADELIVVNTGSVDRTKEIAAQFGARVFDFPWIDSFAAARNECLKHATGDWIFWLDADDRVDAENRERLREVVGRLRNEHPNAKRGNGTKEFTL